MGSTHNKDDNTTSIRISYSKNKGKFLEEEKLSECNTSSVSPRKPLWRAVLLNFTTLFLAIWVIAILLGGVGVLFCEGGEKLIGKHKVFFLSTADVVEQNDTTNENSVQSKKKKFGFLSRKRKKTKTIENVEQTNELFHDSNKDMCKTLGTAITAVSEFTSLHMKPLILKLNLFSKAQPSKLATEEICIKTQVNQQQENKNIGSKLFSRKITKEKTNSDTKHARSGVTKSYQEHTSAQIKQAQELASSIRDKIKKSDAEFDARMRAVSWGGTVPERRPWWSGNRKTGKGENGDGVRLLLGYLKIMNFPEDKITTFPFDLCQKGCPTDFAVLHTLEWREKYKPWLMTPSAIKENTEGWIYVHGHSPDNGDEKGPSVLYFRPGLHILQNEEAYLRTLFNALEFAVVDTMNRSEDKLAKYNVLLDCKDFKIANVGGVREVKRAFRVMKDHFPDKLSHIFFTNLGGPAQLFLKLVTQFIDKNVREKMHIIPNDPKTRAEKLRPLLGDDFTPSWLGGSDTFEFSAEEYYSRSKALVTTEKDGLSYLSTMPYHAS